MLDLAMFGASLLSLPQGYYPPALTSFQVAETARACRRQASRQGMRVTSQGEVRPVTGSRGVLVGTEITLRVYRRGQSYPVRCSYSFYDRTPRIAAWREGWSTGLTVGQQACIAQAERQGMVVRGYRSAQPIIQRRGRPQVEEVVLDVSRGGQDYRVLCNYDRRDRVARVMGN